MDVQKYLNCLRLNWQMLKHCCQGRFLSLADVARSYDRLADDYDRSWLVHLRAVTDQLLALLPAQLVQGDILDLGCGSGYTSSRLLAAYPERHLVAVDISTQMLAQARRRCPGGDFRTADMLAYCRQVPDASQALVLSAWAIGYSQPVKLLREISRVLAPGGSVLFVTNLADTMQPVFLAYRRTLARFPERTKGAIVHHFPPSPAGLADGLRRCGVAVDELLSGEIAIATPAAEDIVDWLLKTGILAGFAEILPIHDDQDVRDYFRQELLLALKHQPLAHHYCIVKGTRRC